MKPHAPRSEHVVFGHGSPGSPGNGNGSYNTPNPQRLGRRHDDPLVSPNGSLAVSDPQIQKYLTSLEGRMSTVEEAVKHMANDIRDLKRDINSVEKSIAELSRDFAQLSGGRTALLGLLGVGVAIGSILTMLANWLRP